MPAVFVANNNPIAASVQVETSAMGNRANVPGFDQTLRRELDKRETATPGGESQPPQPGACAAEAAQALPWLLMLQNYAAGQPADVLPEEGEELGEQLSAQLDQADSLRSQLQQMVGGQGNNSGSAMLTDAEETVGQAVSGAATGNALAANVSVQGGKELPPSLKLVADEGKFVELLQAGQDALSRAEQTVPVGQAPVRLEQAQSQPQVTSHAVIDEPVGHARWGDVVAQRVSLMLGRQEQQMEMQLNPPNLGPMEVRLTLGADQASVVFASQHAAVREALAAATPRLTTLLAEQGIQLVNVQVASDSLQQHMQQQARQQLDSGAQQGQGRTQHSLFDQAATPLPVETVSSMAGVHLPLARSGVSLYI